MPGKVAVIQSEASLECGLTIMSLFYDYVVFMAREIRDTSLKCIICKIQASLAIHCNHGPAFNKCTGVCQDQEVLLVFRIESIFDRGCCEAFSLVKIAHSTTNSKSLNAF